MENINFKHSIIFFNFCILISPLYLMFNFEPVIFCLFLILILGISHGALDNIKGKRLLKLFGYKQTVSFYFTYILISSLIIIFWLIFPNTVLLLFLVVAAYHFGKEDTQFLLNEKSFVNQFLSLMSVPKKDSESQVNGMLISSKTGVSRNFNVFEAQFFKNEFLISMLCLSFLSSLYISKKENTDIKSVMIVDLLSLIINFLSPSLKDLSNSKIRVIECLIE